MDMILMIVAFGAIMYFLMIRPQQKRAKEHQALIAALEPGARVLLSSGLYATLRHMGDRQAIVELAPGTEVTILKGNVVKVVGADEEEFEFDDGEPAVEQGTEQALEVGAVDIPDVFDPRPIEGEPKQGEANQN